MLQTKLAELGHFRVQFKFIKAEAPAGRGPACADCCSCRASASASASASPSGCQTNFRTERGQARACRGERESTRANGVHKDDFKNDPLIQKALEVFKGQIVEVRA